jgi:anti-anti-sigma regulatory factor
MLRSIDVPDVPFAVLGDRRNGIDRLSLIGTLDSRTLSLLASELDDVAHADGAVVLDLHNLGSVDIEAIHALEKIGRRARGGGWLLFIVNVQDAVREAFERDGAGDLLSEDVSGVLSSGDGDWEPISLPPGQRTRLTRLRIIEDAP